MAEQIEERPFRDEVADLFAPGPRAYTMTLHHRGCDAEMVGGVSADGPVFECACGVVVEVRFA